MDLPVPSGATSACGKLATAGSEGEPMPDVRRREFITLLGAPPDIRSKRRAARLPGLPVVLFRPL
jgi:hypothetical protein